MALFNEMNVGRFNAVLHKLLDMKEGAPSPQVSGDVFPVLGLEMDRPEWKFLGGENLFMGGVFLGGSAGKVNQIQLKNPAGSGALVVVEGIQGTLGGNGVLELKSTSGDLTGASLTQVTPGPRDRRITAGFDAGQMWYQTEAASEGLRVMAHNLIASTLFHWDSPIVLIENTGISVTQVSTNTGLTASFQWRTRAVEPSELR